MLKVLVTSFWE